MSDTIYRQQAIDALDGFRCGTKAAWKVIEDLPSAQPERGHWFNPLGDFTPYRCSRCGHYSDSKTPYCAWCGRRASNYD